MFNKSLTKNFIILLLALFFWSGPLWLRAAEIGVQTISSQVKTGEFFLVEVLVSSEESVNAVEGIITFPDNILSLQKINDGDSFISFWVEKPFLLTDGQLRFAGIIPGGFMGSKQRIFSLLFKGLQAGSAPLGLTKVKVYKNDGLGTSLAVSLVEQSVTITDSGDYVQQPLAYDLEAPEIFVPEISSDPSVFNGQWFLVFSAQDKGQGIAYYEVKELENRWLAGGSNWTKISSPYILEDQSRQSYIYVRAVDRAGNDRVVLIDPQNPIAWYENFGFFAIILGALIIAWLLRISWLKTKLQIKH